jgi:hypothetical protein
MLDIRDERQRAHDLSFSLRRIPDGDQANSKVCISRKGGGRVCAPVEYDRVMRIRYSRVGGTVSGTLFLLAPVATGSIYASLAKHGECVRVQRHRSGKKAM